MRWYRRKWIILGGWWVHFRMRHGRKSWMQKEFERGDPDGIVRAYADEIIREMREDD